MAIINGPLGGGAWLPGTSGDDTINAFGNSNSLYGYGGINFLVVHGGNNNNLVGGPGIDHLDGGSGSGNLASYQLSTGRVTASLANPAINTGDAAGDTYVNIHGLTGSPFGGSYYADNSGEPNQLWALGGTNNLYGGTGYTTFIGGPGADHMIGGSGRGFVDYEWSNSGVTASLINPQGNAGEAAGDSYENLRDLGGTAYNDLLTGGDAGGNLRGQAGNDVMHGGVGSDTLNGGPGANTLYGGGSADWFVFGGAAIGAGDVQLDPLTILTDARQGTFTTVMDFDQSSGHFDTNEYDSIDLAPLLSSQYNHGHGQQVSNLVRLIEYPTNAYASLQVDVDGSGTNWLTVAHLNGVPTGASVRVILDESETSGVSLLVQASSQIVRTDITGVAGQCYRLYEAAFNRIPDIAGLSSNVNMMDHGVTIYQMSAAFVGSAEFVQRYGANLTNQQFLTALYQNVLDRVPDNAEVAGWSSYLNSGHDRADVLIGFSESAENHAAVDPTIVQGIVLEPYWMH